MDVRIITATNGDLPALVREGKFREDLYYRINVLPLSLPPLRERREDIMPLAHWFLERFRAVSPRLARTFGSDAVTCLESYDWPGNIRELRNCVDRASIICRDEEIDVASLLLPAGSRDTAEDSEAINEPGDPIFHASGIHTLKEIEDAYIRYALGLHDGNRSQTARGLGISVRGLRYRLNAEDEGTPTG